MANRLPDGVRRLFRLGTVQPWVHRDIDDELRFHFDEAVRELVERGLTEEQALEKARANFGDARAYRAALEGIDGRRARRRSIAHWGERLLDDLRNGFRSLRRSATFTTMTVTILTVGIGTTTAVLTAFRSVVLEDMPVTDPDRLVIFSLRGQSGDPMSLVSAELDMLRDESHGLQDVAGVVPLGAEAIPLTEGNRSLVLNMSRVSADFFRVLGVRPVLGRLLQPADGVEGLPLVVVLSHTAWQNGFGGDPGVVGRTLTRTGDQRSIAIVGVAPPGLDYPPGVDYWIVPRSGDGMDVVARLAPGVTPDAAQAEFLSISQLLDSQRSDPRSPEAVTSRSLSDAVLGDSRPILTSITAAIALLLLLVCANVGNLLFMRVTRRSNELRVRQALGATSGRVARLFLVEGGLLGVAGGVLGLALAVVLLRALPTFAPDWLPRAEMIGLAGTPGAVAVAVTAVCILLFGVLPPLNAARGDLASGLRTDRRSGTGTKGRRRVRQVLVTVQVGLAVVLLFTAGLLMRSLQNLGRIELGYDMDGVAVVEFGIGREGEEGPWELIARLEGALDHMRDVPGVRTATLIMSRPFMGSVGIFETRPTVEGQTEFEAESNPRVSVEVGGGELFPTLGIPIVRGRGLLETDREDAPKVAVVSRIVAAHFWPGEDPVGQRIRLVTSRPEWWTVVGVAGETRFRRLREPTPTIYLPYRQLQILPGVWTVAVRTEEDFASVLPAIRQGVREFDPRINVWRTGTLNTYLASGPLAQPRTSAFVLSGFGAGALFLAAIGLYGVMALAVRERTYELGVRRALGASVTRLRQDVLRDALVMTVAGTVAGLAATLLVSRLLGTLLFDVDRADPVTLLGVCATLLSVSLLAAYMPASQATRVDPRQALQAE